MFLFFWCLRISANLDPLKLYIIIECKNSDASVQKVICEEKTINIKTRELKHQIIG